MASFYLCGTIHKYMDKDKLLELRAGAERRFNDMSKQRDTYKAQYDEACLEVARIQGDYRTYEDLLENWTEAPLEAEIINKPKEKK